MAKAYRMKRATSSMGYPEGTIVYKASRPDYGCASDDSRITGVEHVSVTLDRNGDYPFFTIPVDDIEALALVTEVR